MNIFNSLLPADTVSKNIKSDGEIQSDNGELAQTFLTIASNLISSWSKNINHPNKLGESFHKTLNTFFSTMGKVIETIQDAEAQWVVPLDVKLELCPWWKVL